MLTASSEEKIDPKLIIEYFVDNFQHNNETLHYSLQFESNTFNAWSIKVNAIKTFSYLWAYVCDGGKIDFVHGVVFFFSL